MFSFYIKKTFVDMVPGIELVNIHYTWTPLGELPNWQSQRETRAMPRGGVLVRGMGGTTLDEAGQPISGRRIRQTGGKIIGVMWCTFSERLWDRESGRGSGGVEVAPLTSANEYVRNSPSPRYRRT